jgi:zinc protease
MHPYGHLDIGTEASIQALTRQELHDFWKAHFVPGNAALVVAGDMSMAQLRAVAQKAFGAWAKGPAVSRASLATPAPAGARVVIVDRPAAPQTQLRVQSTAPPRSTPDYPVLRVLNHILGGTFSSRINMNLREEHGYTYGANSQFTFRKGPGPFTVASGVRTDVTAPAVSEIVKEIAKIRGARVEDDELRRAKDALLLSLPAAFGTNESAIGNYASLFIHGLGHEYFSRYPGQLRAVTAEQVFEAARKYIVPGQLAVVAVGDAAQIEPGLRSLTLGPVEVRNADGSRR